MAHDGVIWRAGNGPLPFPMALESRSPRLLLLPLFPLSLFFNSLAALFFCISVCQPTETTETTASDVSSWDLQPSFWSLQHNSALCRLIPPHHHHQLTPQSKMRSVASDSEQASSDLRDVDSGYASVSSSEASLPEIVFTKPHIRFLNKQLQFLEPQGTCCELFWDCPAFSFFLSRWILTGNRQNRCPSVVCDNPARSLPDDRLWFNGPCHP
jgi:hypothetical protein